jgi:ribosomal protein L12E/L44/L45/RPP1/RPP2
VTSQPSSPGDEPSPPPVVRKVRVSRSALRKNNPASSGHSAVVYVLKDGEYRLGSGRLTMGELWLATPLEMYLVDITPQEEIYSRQLPSKEEAFMFTASVRVSWQVTDPVAAVRAGEVEPRETIGRHMEERLREVSRQFGVEQSADAERRIAHEYRDRVVSISAGVQITGCSAVLDLDEATREHMASRTQLARESETELNTHELQVLRAAHAQELEKLAEKHELELKQERLKLYADALRGDDVNVLALRLAGHNEDVKDVINLLKEQKQLGLENANTVLKFLLDHKLVNRKDVAHLMVDAGNTVLGLSPTASAPQTVAAKSARTDLTDDEEDEEEDDGDDG